MTWFVLSTSLNPLCCKRLDILGLPLCSFLFLFLPSAEVCPPSQSLASSSTEKLNFARLVSRFQLCFLFFSPKDNVLPPMATSCTAHPEAIEPGTVVQPLHVYGLLPAQLPAGEEALHHMCFGLPRCPLPHLLQLLGKLLSVPLSRRHTARCGQRPSYSRNLRRKSVTVMWTVDWIFLFFFSTKIYEVWLEMDSAKL